MDFFDPDWRLPRDYLLFEQAFLGYARAVRVPPSGLDVLIWDQMRQIRRRAAPTVHAEVGAGIPISALFPCSFAGWFQGSKGPSPACRR